MVKIFSGTSNIVLATAIAHDLGLQLSPLDIHIFPDGEKRVRVVDRVVDEHVIVIAPTAPPVDTNYMELFFIVDGLKRSGAEVVTAVVPYLGYQRQDHIFRDGEAVSLEVVAKTLTSVGTNKVIAVDLHALRTPDLFPIPMTHLSALPLFAEKIKEILRIKTPLFSNDAQDEPKKLQSQDQSSLSESRLPDRGSEGVKSTFNSFENKDSFALLNSDSVLVSPDMGGVRRVKILSELLDGMSFAAIEKDRDLVNGNVTSQAFGIGDVTGKKVAFIIDDMISSGKTIAVAVDLLRKNGIEKIFVFATHAIFSEEAPQILQFTRTQEIFVTDTVFIPEDKKFSKLTVLSVAKTIAEALR